MREMIIPAAIASAIFFAVLALAMALGYYIGISAGEVFGTPEFGETTETSVVVGALMGLILGMASFAITSSS